MVAEGAPEEPVIITMPDDTFEPEPIAFAEEIASTPEPESKPETHPEPVHAAEPEIAPAFSVAPTEQVSPETAVEHPVSSPFPDPADATAHAAPSSAGMPGGAFERTRVSEEVRTRVSEEVRPVTTAG